MNELTVLLPAFNEEECLEKLVASWEDIRERLYKEYQIALHIVVINDGSQDRTRCIGEGLEKKYDHFTLVNHEKNRGLGCAVNTGLRYVVEQGEASPFCCVMDCDNTHDPIYIFDMLDLQQKENKDVVIASRYQKGAKVNGVSPFRLLTSEGARYVYSCLLGVKGVKDYTCGYRLYKKEIVKAAYRQFNDQLIEENGFTCMAELLYKLSLCGASFGEIPFELHYDYKEGSSKMKVLKTVINSFKLVFHLRRLHKTMAL